jgi:hypothetical protein
MTSISRPVSVLAVGAMLLMAAALAADVAINSTNIDLTGYADIAGPPPASNDSVLDVVMTGFWPSARAGGFHAPSTGTAVFADAAGGVGVRGDSEGSYGVWGTSDSSWGGYFTSTGGYGIRVSTTGAAHYDHGAYVTSNGGYGVYVQSTSNQGVRGEAGNVSGISQPLGAVGVVGIGANRGSYGSSSSGVGVYGVSSSNYGVWGQSSTSYGATGRTSRTDNNYGLYTPDNLYSLNHNKLGATMQVAHNGGDEPLEVGDVVVFSGVLRPEQRQLTATGEPAPSAFNDQPVVQVARAGGDAGALLAGVVFSRFNLEAVDDSDLIQYDLEEVDDPLERFRKARATGQEVEITPPGPVAPGEYLLVVILGPAKVRVSGLERAIRAGDGLAAGVEPGRAVHYAVSQAVKGGEAAARPQLVGAALEPVISGRETIYAYVSLR